MKIFIKGTIGFSAENPSDQKSLKLDLEISGDREFESAMRSALRTPVICNPPARKPGVHPPIMRPMA